jgi:hypothetical protein
MLQRTQKVVFAMATEVHLKNDQGVLAKGFVGFSWTCLFFGFFVPLFRGDWKWFLIMLIVCLCTFGLANLVLCFIYNRIYTKALLVDKNFFPSDDYSKSLLVQAGIFA